jgi:cytochrome d ubiquinol oxidase subunit II
LVVGFLSLSLFAYLSACYLIVEAVDSELREDFRKRAIFSGFASVIAAFGTYVAAGNSAQGILDGLSRSPYAWLIEGGAAIAAVVAFQALWSRSYLRARIAAAAQVALIVIGWGIAQYPYLVRPELTIFTSASPTNILVDLEIAVAVGAVILIPSLALLLLIFKTDRKSIPAKAGTTYE